MNNSYKVLPGPEGFLAPAASLMGVELPDEGGALIEGIIVEEETAMVEIAKKLLNAKKTAIFVGPLLIWNWNDDVSKKAKLVKKLAEIIDAKIIPMPDYRHKYPKINPETEVNPNHPNLTINHNGIDVCILLGIHCHYENVAVKIIRGETDCYTISLCDKTCHEDAMISLRDIDAEKLQKLIEVIKAESGK